MVHSSALRRDQRGIDVAIDIDRALGELILQRACACAFGDAERGGRVAAIGLPVVELHQDIDVERVVGAFRAEVARAQIRRADARTFRFDQRDRLLDLAARAVEIAGCLRDARTARVRDGLPRLVVGLARDLQRLLVIGAGGGEIVQPAFEIAKQRIDDRFVDAPAGAVQFIARAFEQRARSRPVRGRHRAAAEPAQRFGTRAHELGRLGDNERAFVCALCARDVAAVEQVVAAVDVDLGEA